MSELDMTLRQFLESTRKFGAGVSAIAARKESGELIYALICLDGPDSQEILDAIEKVQASWDEQITQPAASPSTGSSEVAR